VVILAWDHVNASSHPAGSGHNVVLHEFAHQLEAEDGSPSLGARAQYAASARVLGAEDVDLAQRLRGEPFSKTKRGTRCLSIEFGQRSTRFEATHQARGRARHAAC
jgi:hypothetical protein